MCSILPAQFLHSASPHQFSIPHLWHHHRASGILPPLLPAACWSPPVLPDPPPPPPRPVSSSPDPDVEREPTPIPSPISHSLPMPGVDVPARCFRLGWPRLAMTLSYRLQPLCLVMKRRSPLGRTRGRVGIASKTPIKAAEKNSTTADWHISISVPSECNDRRNTSNPKINRYSRLLLWA